MTDSTISSLIALAGVFISVVTSLFVSLRRARIETRKLRDEYLHLYAGKLFEKRIEVYPALFHHLVDVIHNINLGKVSAKDIKKLFQASLEWDAENAIFLSAHSQQITHRLFLMLADLNKKSNTDLQKILDNRESLLQIKRHLLKLTLALKNDLGIYSLESPSTITKTKVPSSYREVDELADIKEEHFIVNNMPQDAT